MKEIRDIEWLLNWAFENQRVETAIKMAIPKLPNISGGGFKQLMELGVRVDSSSAGERWGSARCHDDAVIIYDLVCRLPKEAMGILVIHARAGTRPDWCEAGIGCEEAVLDGRGRTKKIWRDPINRTGLIGVQTKWVGHRPEVVEFQRAQYLVWREALKVLVIPVNKELTNFQSTMPRCAKQPWEIGLREIIKIPA